jgi:hypothetical protein
MGPRTGVDDVEKRKVFSCWDSSFESSIVRPLVRRSLGSIWLKVTDFIMKLRCSAVINGDTRTRKHESKHILKYVTYRLFQSPRPYSVRRDNDRYLFGIVRFPEIYIHLLSSSV